MVNSFFVLAPSLIVLQWAVILLFRREKSKSMKYLTILAFLFSAFFFIDANYSDPNPDYRLLIYINILSQVVTFTMFPMVILYICSVLKWKANSFLLTTLFFPPIFMGGAMSIIYLIMGTGQAARYIEAYKAYKGHPEGYDLDIYYVHDLFSVTIFKYLICFWLITSVVLLCVCLYKNNYRFGNLKKFFREGKDAPLSNAICLILLASLILGSSSVFMGREYMATHHGICWLIFTLQTILQFFFVYLGWGFDGTTVRASELRNNKNTRIRIYLEQHPELLKLIRSQAEEANLKKREQTLMEKIDNYMSVMKPYLDPKLTIEDLAEAVSSNRTYVANEIKEKYNKTFRSYINEKRVQTAVEILRENPNKLLSIVAEESGFTSDSVLSKRFSEIMGETPRAWVNYNSGSKITSTSL